MGYSRPVTVDVAIVGAGTSGAAAAALCARRGLSVVCIDRRPLDQAGARWVNGVHTRFFEEAGIAPPKGDELVGRGVPFHLFAGHGPERLVVRDHDLLEVDMRKLVARLQELGRRAGVTFLEETTVDGVGAGALRTSSGPVEARWVVDASGLAGARLLGAPPVPPKDLCVAAQEVRDVTDRAGVRDFYATHGATLGEVICFTGVAGGYSIVNVRADETHVAILTGSIPALGHPAGVALLEGFVAAQPWVGPRRFGGSRAIPLRRSRDQLAVGAVALLGDAGCQVFPAHGSGIGPGLVAAHVLAEALAEGDGLAGYAVQWQRRFGGLHAAYDLFRRFSQELDVEDLRRMIGSGLMDSMAVRAGLEQRLPPLRLG